MSSAWQLGTARSPGSTASCPGLAAGGQLVSLHVGTVSKVWCMGWVNMLALAVVPSAFTVTRQCSMHLLAPPELWAAFAAGSFRIY